MMPHEAAAVIKDALMSDPQIRNFKLSKSEPKTVGGKMGFRMIYTYTDHQGVDTKCEYYGVVLPKSFFNIRYTAAQRYYFDKDVEVFHQAVASLHFSSP